MVAFLLGCKSFQNKEKTKTYYKADFALFNDSGYVRVLEQFLPDINTYDDLCDCEMFKEFTVRADINDFGNPILKVCL